MREGERTGGGVSDRTICAAYAEMSRGVLRRCIRGGGVEREGAQETRPGWKGPSVNEVRAKGCRESAATRRAAWRGAAESSGGTKRGGGESLGCHDDDDGTRRRCCDVEFGGRGRAATHNKSV